VFELSEARAREIYFQNPAFGCAVLQTIIARLTEDIALSQRDDNIAPSSPDSEPAVKQSSAA
jgi:hypothetical protein